MADIDDRWWRTARGPDGKPLTDEQGRPVKEKTSRHGTGLRYVARWRDHLGRQRSKGFHRKGDADRHLATVKTDLARGSYVDPVMGKTTLRAYAADWLATRTSDESTRGRLERELRNHILPALGDYELRVLATRPTLIQAWLRDRQTGERPLAASSLGVVFSTLSGVLSAAVDDGFIARNPCSLRSIRPPAKPRGRVVPWTAQQTVEVIEALPAPYRALGVVGAGCGLRQGEAFGLAFDDVDFLRNTVHVRRQVKVVGDRLVLAPPKGGKERDVPLPESVKVELSQHIQAHPPVAVRMVGQGGREVTTRLLFTGPAGEALHRNWFNRHVWKRALTAAGMTGGREDGFHALRHFYASALLDGGESIKAVSTYLGHHSAAFTLATYTHLMPTSEERSRKAIDQAFQSAYSAPNVRQATP